MSDGSDYRSLEGKSWLTQHYSSSTVLSMVFRYASRYLLSCLLYNRYLALTDISSGQPDGYLTEERKAAEPDHGFSTFFSETGMLTLKWMEDGF